LNIAEDVIEHQALRVNFVVRKTMEHKGIIAVRTMTEGKYATVRAWHSLAPVKSFVILYLFSQSAKENNLASV
jgi:hypothetical protein